MRALLVIALLAVSGCGVTVSKEPSTSLGDIDRNASGVTSAVEHARRAVAAAMAAKINDEVRAYLRMAQEAHDVALEKAAELQVSLKQAQKESQAKDAAIELLQRDLQALNGTWYVRLGRFLTGAFWTVLVAWGVLGIASVALGLAPWTWGRALGREIVRMLPFMNIFSHARDYFTRRRAATAATSISEPEAL